MAESTKQRALIDVSPRAVIHPVSQRTMRANIRRVYRSAHPLEIAYGRAWYQTARESARDCGALRRAYRTSVLCDRCTIAE